MDLIYWRVYMIRYNSRAVRSLFWTRLLGLNFQVSPGFFRCPRIESIPSVLSSLFSLLFYFIVYILQLVLVLLRSSTPRQFARVSPAHAKSCPNGRTSEYHSSIMHHHHHHHHHPPRCPRNSDGSSTKSSR